MTTRLRDSAFLLATMGICPQCGRLVPAKLLEKEGRIVRRHLCPEHGSGLALVSSDSRWYLDSLEAQTRGAIPRRWSTSRKDGCPNDCGLCDEHEQHTCLPIVEITDHCDLDCPICLVETRGRWFMTPETYERAIDHVLATEGVVPVLNVSGGEPTLHPDLPRILDLSRRPGIQRVVVNTSGTALARDESLLDLFARKGVYAALQLDGFEEEPYRRIRGRDLLDSKMRALEGLKRYGIKTTLALTLVPGVNEGSLGKVIDLVCSEDHILSLTIQPAAFCGRGRGFARGGAERITIPRVLELITEQCGGWLAGSDFLPLPCSHPACFAFAYLLRMGEGEWKPFARFVEIDRYRAFLANKGLLEVDSEEERFISDTIDRLWTSAGVIPDSERILGAIKRALAEAFPRDRKIPDVERIQLGEKRVKSVFVHAFMDAETFDLARAIRCCTHYVKGGNRSMPACVYNNLVRPRGDGP